MIDIQLNECEIFEKTVFNRLVEAVPSKDQSAATVITFLTREVMPRFGIPSQISSRRKGSVYSENTQTSDLTSACQIKTRLCLQSSNHKVWWREE